MRQIAWTTAAALMIALPAKAESEGDDGLSLMERGAQMFFEGIMREMEPALEDLQGLSEDMGPALREFVDQMGPALADLLGEIEDLSAYHPPEILPNGDIILRRKMPEEMVAPSEGEIDI
ncbi:MAG: hypothetical protein AAGF56_03700 [Pseudomonadota bacterium]